MNKQEEELIPYKYMSCGRWQTKYITKEQANKLEQKKINEDNEYYFVSNKKDKQKTQKTQKESYPKVIRIFEDDDEAVEHIIYN